jgi:hypothetical protein
MMVGVYTSSEKCPPTTDTLIQDILNGSEFSNQYEISRKRAAKASSENMKDNQHAKKPPSNKEWINNRRVIQNRGKARSRAGIADAKSRNLKPPHHEESINRNWARKRKKYADMKKAELPADKKIRLAKIANKTKRDAQKKIMALHENNVAAEKENITATNLEHLARAKKRNMKAKVILTPNVQTKLTSWLKKPWTTKLKERVAQGERWLVLWTTKLNK